MARRIPVAGPWITEKELSYVAEAAANGWYGSANLYQERFEKAFAEFLGLRFACSLPSCTSAIHLSLLSLGVGPGDEVIVPDITWIASSAPVDYVGATPVFADIDGQSWCLSPRSVEELITPRTRAVIAVDLYGNMPEMDGLTALARERGLALIEDAAEAVGAEYRGRPAGSFGEAGVFSFHGSKTLTTGEGGMLVTDREDLYRRSLFLRNHAASGEKMFWNTEIGFKYRMTSLQAALGLAQLERLEELMSKKRCIFDWYRRELAPVQGITLNQEAPQTRSSYWMVTAILDPRYGMEKDALIAAMGERAIDCRPFFRPLSSLPAYQGREEALRARERNRTAYAISPYGINLPSALSLTEEEVSRVSQTLKSILERS
jgi:perosamine synthetase